MFDTAFLNQSIAEIDMKISMAEQMAIAARKDRDADLERLLRGFIYSAKQLRIAKLLYAPAHNALQDALRERGGLFASRLAAKAAKKAATQ